MDSGKFRLSRNHIWRSRYGALVCTMVYFNLDHYYDVCFNNNDGKTGRSISDARIQNNGSITIFLNKPFDEEAFVLFNKGDGFFLNF